MIVGSIKENITSEKRVSLTPESAKNIIGLGLKVYVEKGYALHLGINDSEYKDVGVEIKDNSDDYSLFAVQGPNAEKVCSQIFNEDLSGIKYYTFTERETNDFGNVIISATGYTGAGGFELYVKNK